MDAVGEIDAADGDGDHVGAGSGVSARHFLEAAILSGANDQAGAKGAASDDEFVCHSVLDASLNALQRENKFGVSKIPAPARQACLECSGLDVYSTETL